MKTETEFSRKRAYMIGLLALSLCGVVSRGRNSGTTEIGRKLLAEISEQRAEPAGASYVALRLAAPKLEAQHHPKAPEIEKGIPVPTQTRGGTRRFDSFYPLEQMQPGNSFWVPSETGCTLGAVSKFARKSGWKFVTRGQTKEGQKNSEVSGKRKGLRGIRVWRTG